MSKLPYFIITLVLFSYTATASYDFEASCLSSVPRISDEFKTGDAKGMACLERLAKSGSGARRNLGLYKNMLAHKKVKVICSETDLFQRNSSIATSRSLNNKFQIYLRPKANWTSAQLQSTVFHENFHFFGYLHGYDIEYPTACEECCFINDLGLKNKISCEICAGNFQDLADMKYASLLPQLVDLSYENPSRFYVELFARIALIQKPASKEHLWLLSYYARHFDPVSIFWSQRLLKDKIVTGEKWLERASRILPSESSITLPLVNQVVDLMVAMYVHGDLKEAQRAFMEIDSSLMKTIRINGQQDYYQWLLLREIQNNLWADYKALVHAYEKRGMDEDLKGIQAKYNGLADWWYNSPRD